MKFRRVGIHSPGFYKIVLAILESTEIKIYVNCELMNSAKNVPAVTSNFPDDSMQTWVNTYCKLNLVVASDFESS